MHYFTFVNQTRNGAWSAGASGTDLTAIYLELNDIQWLVEMVSSVHWMLLMPSWMHK